METVKIEINAELAREYFRKYQEVCRQQKARKKFQDFLRAFAEDRLREEIEFLDKEMDATPAS